MAESAIDKLKKRAKAFETLNTKQKDYSERCMICFVDYADTDEVVSLPCNDKHIFHQECMA